MVGQVLLVAHVEVLLDGDVEEAVVRGHHAGVAHGKMMKVDFAISHAQVSRTKGLGLEKFVDLVQVFRRGNLASIQLIGRRTSEQVGDRV